MELTEAVPSARTAVRRLVAAGNRYRPYVIAVVAALVVTLVPTDGGDGGTDVTAAQAGSADVLGSAGDGSAGTEAAAGDATGSVGAGSAGQRSGSGPAGSGSRPAPTAAGLGTSAALAAPDCDPATKRMKVSFTRAAPCAAPWPEGADNGGATWQGVTKDEIKVVIFNPPADPAVPPVGRSDESTHLKNWNDASAPYQRFYRMYGRKVAYAVYEGTGNDEVAQRADAIKIAAMKPFAVVQVQPSSTILLTELATRGIIAIASAAVAQTTAEKLAPYVWGASVQSAELCALAAANYVPKRLMGRPAKWAGQPDYQALTRKFGLLITSDVDPKFFKNDFSRLGGTLADEQTYSFGGQNASRWAEQARTMVARMKSKGVTSVIAVADFLFLGIITKEATNQQWFPEWITSGLLGSDIDPFAKTFDQVQWQHAFGVGSLYAGSNILAPQFHFQKWYWADGYTPAGEGLGPDETPLLHAGIHGAGPKLTPETFRDGAFAVVPTGGAHVDGKMTMAYSFGRWGFYPGDDYNGYDDFNEIWWDASGQGKDNLLGQDTVGLYRIMNGGKRYLFNQWPTGEPPAFDRNGVAPYFTDYSSPGERPPDIPCTGCPSSK